MRIWSCTMERFDSLSENACLRFKNLELKGLRVKNRENFFTFTNKIHKHNYDSINRPKKFTRLYLLDKLRKKVSLFIHILLSTDKKISYKNKFVPIIVK